MECGEVVTVSCKDDYHDNEIEAPDSVVKDLMSYKIMKRFDKKARLLITTGRARLLITTGKAMLQIPAI